MIGIGGTGWDLGGDGDDSSPVTTLAEPSEAIDKRTFDGARSREAGDCLASTEFMVV